MKTMFAAHGGKRLIACLACACLAFMARNSDAQIASTGAQLAAIKLMQQQLGLDNDTPNQTNPNGLRIQFQKISEVQEKDGHLVRYRLLVPGAPEKQVYGLEVWRIGTELQLTPQPVYTNAKGLLMWHEPTPHDEDRDSLSAKEEIEVDLKAARGEPIRYMLASTDGKIFIPGTIVPYPAESKNGNCKLEARLGFPEGEGMLVYVDGLASGAAVPLQTVSGSVTHAPPVIADAHGHAEAIISPAVQGTNAGVVKISVTTRACSMSLELPWGDGSYRPM
ncbi:MAG: hypothetical protein ABSD67_06645 [Terracidiphilus sp.]